MPSFPYRAPPVRPASPRYDSRSNVGIISHAAFVLLVIGLAVALILIVLVAGELRGGSSQVARHLAQAQAASMSQGDMPASAMPQR